MYPAILKPGTKEIMFCFPETACEKTGRENETSDITLVRVPQGNTERHIAPELGSNNPKSLRVFFGLLAHEA